MTAITRSEDHHYTYQGVTYPGVTGILKVLDKSAAMMSWAAKNTAQAALELHGSGGLASLVESVGAEGAIKALTSRSEWKRDEAAQLGTEVHNLADMVNRGVPTPSMTETVRDRVLAYAEWWRNSGWSLRLSEAMLVNTVAGYGGTLDLLARDRDGRTILADIKTGKGIYHETALQLAAYGMAEVIQDQSGNVFNMPEVQRYVILHVTAGNVREVEVAVGTPEHEAFYACLNLSQWRESMKGKRL